MNHNHPDAKLVDGSRFELTGDAMQPSLIILDHDWWQANQTQIYDWMAEHLSRGIHHHFGSLLNFSHPRERMMFLLRWS